jgi:hypothetical protein
MNMYETVFYWVGVASTVIFGILGVSIFSAWVMNMVWARFQDGKKLMDIMLAYRSYTTPKD